MRPIVTLTTDFGNDDPFVGIMKGVILSVAPQAEIIDIAHQVRPQDVAQAARALQAAWSYFPEKTVHLVVVDPGVGGTRRPLAAEYASHKFVGPDNGVLTPILKPGSRVYELDRPKYFLKTVSRTFHGRDVFAPVAAWIARGTRLASLGSRISDPRLLDLPRPSFKKNKLTGQIVYIDRFGNLISNIPAEWLGRCFGNVQKLTITVGKKKIGGFFDSYSQANPGECGGIVNSWDHLEIFCREGSAAKKLHCGLSETVVITPDRPKP